MEIEYLKCHHGNLKKDYCPQCSQEKFNSKDLIYQMIEEHKKDTRIPILKGCKNKLCFCTGECKEIIGYIHGTTGEDQSLGNPQFGNSL